MRVILISANKLKVPYPVYPLGVDHVVRSIAASHDVQVCDLVWASSDQDVQAAIRDFTPDLVGLAIRNIDNTDVTQMSSFIDEYLYIVRLIKQTTSAPIVLGGAGFTIFPDELMSALDANYGIVGEGERVSLLLQALEKGEDPAGIDGVVTQDKPAVIPEPWQNPGGSRTEDMLLDPIHYLELGGMLNLQTKRGCPHGCIYCTYPRIEGHRLRLFPPGDVGREARRLQEAGARFLFVTDATFNSDVKHNLEVARAMKDYGVTIPWGAFFAPLEAPEGYYARLAEAGLTHVEFGTDSLTDRVLEAYRKPFRVADVYRAHRSALSAGLNVAHYLLLGGPSEDHKTLEETLTRAEQLENCVLFFFCGMRIYPHTPLYGIASREGCIQPCRSLLEPIFYRSEALKSLDVESAVRQRARGRLTWVFGAGGEKLTNLMVYMYRKGHVGPLWEKLIR